MDNGTKLPHADASGLEDDGLVVSLQYYDADVCATFRGFARPDRENILTQSTADLRVGSNGCDGIVVLNVDGLQLTMGTDKARRLAADLIAEADAHDAKLDEDDDDEESWQEIACRLARDAYNQREACLRGCGRVAGTKALCLTDSRPDEQRDARTAELRKRLADRGLKVLAYTTHPLAGWGDPKEAGHSYALLIEAEPELIDWVLSTAEDIRKEFPGS